MNFSNNTIAVTYLFLVICNKRETASPEQRLYLIRDTEINGSIFLCVCFEKLGAELKKTAIFSR
jgi:hypothetical protein